MSSCMAGCSVCFRGVVHWSSCVIWTVRCAPLCTHRVIEFQSIGEAEQAIKKMTDTKLKGRPIFVREVCVCVCRSCVCSSCHVDLAEHALLVVQDRESKSYSFQQRYKGLPPNL